VVSGIVLSTVIIYIIIQVVKRIKAPETSLVSEKRELEDFLKVFTKPGIITKEEISISIEKKICLVCKSKVSRLNYICPECEVLYCARCSNALSNLENICWVCETPFNEALSQKRGGEKDDIHIF
jgi:predicted amidophosphoribosyltransferase